MIHEKVHRTGGVTITNNILGKIREPFVDEVLLGTVRVMVKEVLKLMGKCSFIQIGFWSIGTRPVIPIVIVDRHHVAIGKLTDGGGEITGYVAGIVGIIEVGILDIGYQDGHPAVLLPTTTHLGVSPCPLFGGAKNSTSFSYML